MRRDLHFSFPVGFQRHLPKVDHELIFVTACLMDLRKMSWIVGEFVKNVPGFDDFIHRFESWFIWCRWLDGMRMQRNVDP